MRTATFLGLSLLLSGAQLVPSARASLPQEGIRYSGRAFDASLVVPTLGVGPQTISDTGELPSGGGSRSSSLASVDQPGVLSASILSASTSGADGVAHSAASLVDVIVLPGHAAQLTASVVRAESEASCLGVSGSTTITDLTFGGIAVAVTGEPNQIVSIPGIATLVVNEQTSSVDTATRSIRVRAIHLTLVTGDEVILSHAESGIVLPAASSAIFAGDGINADTITPVDAVQGSIWSAPLRIGHPHGSGGPLFLRIHRTTMNGNDFVSPVGGRLTEFLVAGPLTCHRTGTHDGRTGDIPPQTIPCDCTLIGTSWAVQYTVVGGGFIDLSQAVTGVVGIQ